MKSHAQFYSNKEVTYDLGLQLACLHDQNKSGFFGGPAFIQPIRAICNVFKKTWLAEKKPALQKKKHFCFDHVKRLNMGKPMITNW